MEILKLEMFRLEMVILKCSDWKYSDWKLRNAEIGRMERPFSATVLTGTFESTLHCQVHLRSLHGYFVCARGSISRELSIESCKLASCRHSTVQVRAELVTTNCVASYLKERTIVNTILVYFRVLTSDDVKTLYIPVQVPPVTTRRRYFLYITLAQVKQDLAWLGMDKTTGCAYSTEVQVGL